MSKPVEHGISVDAVIREVKVCIGLSNIEKSLEKESHLNRLKGNDGFFKEKVP
jgi:hypothetical protein